MVDNAYDSGNLETIENEIKKAVEMCEEEYGTQCVLYASMLSEMGGYYRGQRKFEESIDYFTRALNVLEQNAGKDSPDFATGLNNIAGTYRMMGEYNKAEAAFMQCLDIYEKTVGKNHVYYAAGLNNLALLALDQDDNEKAANLLQKCTDILKENPQARDEYATSLVNTASLYYNLRRFDDAQKNLQEAVKLYETELGTMTPHYHAAMNTLGLVYREKEKYEEAKMWFGKSMEAAKKLYGENHPEYLEAFSNYQMI